MLTRVSRARPLSHGRSISSRRPPINYYIFFSGLNVNDTVSVADVELRPLSSMTRTLEDIKFPFVMDPNLFDAYLGSSQHLSPVLTTFRNLNFQVLFANLAGTTTDACAPYCITGEGHLTAQQLDLLRLTPLVDVVKVRWPHAWLNLVQVYQKTRWSSFGKSQQMRQSLFSCLRTSCLRIRLSSIAAIAASVTSFCWTWIRPRLHSYSTLKCTGSMLNSSRA